MLGAALPRALQVSPPRGFTFSREERRLQELLQRHLVSPCELADGHVVGLSEAAFEVADGLLGHASVQLTLDRYSHWMPSMGKLTASAMDEVLEDRDDTTANEREAT
jgi:integrase